MEENDSSDCHVNGDAITNSPRNSTKGLSRVNSISKCMTNSGDDCGSDQVGGDKSIGTCQYVEETNSHEWQTVLKIVSVRSAIKIQLTKLIIRKYSYIPSNSFNVFVAKF